MFGLIHDFSGSSFHYNADFGEDSLDFVSRESKTTTTTSPAPGPTTTVSPVATTAPAVVNTDTTTSLATTTTLPREPVRGLPETGPVGTSRTAAVAGLLLGLGVLARLAAARPRRSNG